MDDDDYIDIQFRTPEEIAARLFITEALTLRLVAEDQWQSGEEPDDGPEEIFYDLRRVLRDAAIEHALSQNDRRLLKMKLGRIKSQDLILLTNQTLTADAIAMFCGLIPWRPFWAKVDQDAHFRLDLHEDSIPEVASRLTLPSEEDAAKAQEVAEFFTWRLMGEMELRQSSGIDRVTIRKSIDEAVAEVGSAGLVELGDDGDMLMDDKPVTAIEDQILVIWSLFAMMREKAINWLCGMGPNWDKVPSINA